MLRALLALGWLTGCVTTGSSFTRAPPDESALVYGFLRVDGQPVEQMILGQRGGVSADASSAMLDAIGSFAFLVPPGDWFLYSYSPPGRMKRIRPEATPYNPTWDLEVKSGELHWVGAFEERTTIITERFADLQRRDDITQRDVLQALLSQAGGTRWEPVILRELARLTPANP